MSFEPEALLGEQDGAALRRFFEWGVGHGFDLAIAQITTPWKRDALIAWAQGNTPGVQVIPMDELGPGKQRLWDVLREATAPEKNTSVLIFYRLEEAEAQERLVAQLNVERDEIVKAFALPWLFIVHPTVAQVMERKGPDFVDFAGLWLWEEKPEHLQSELAAIDASPTVVASMPMEGLGTDKELLGKAEVAIDLGYTDEASDLLAQFDMRNPDAREGDPHRMALEGRMLAVKNRYAEAKAAHERALQGYEARGDRHGRAIELNHLAMIEDSQGRYDEARRLLEASFELVDELEDRMGRATLCHQLAHIALRQGRLDEARRLLRESIEVTEALGDRRGLAASLHQLAIVEEHEGRFDEARRLLRKSIGVKEELGDRRGLAASLHQLALIEEHEGRFDEARRLVRKSIELKELTGNREGRSASLHLLAIIEWRQGRLDEAGRLLRESIEVSEEIGNRAGLAASQINLGALEVAQGRVNEGRHLVQTGVDTLQAIGSGDLEAARVILHNIDALLHPPAPT